jgi:hypothetical protein
MEHDTLKAKKSRKPKKNQEYAQGIEASRKFEQTMEALFQVPKVDSKKSKKARTRPLYAGQPLPLIGGASLYPFRLVDYM